MKLRYERITKSEFVIFEGDDEIGGIVAAPLVTGGRIFAFWPKGSYLPSNPTFDGKPIVVAAINIKQAAVRLSRTLRNRAARVDAR